MLNCVTNVRQPGSPGLSTGRQLENINKFMVYSLSFMGLKAVCAVVR